MLIGCPTENVPGIRNADPRAQFTNHSDGDQIDAGLQTFTGLVSDPDHGTDELMVAWLYEGEEACPTLSPDSDGNTSCEIFLELGDRSISLQVEDPLGGIGVAQIDIDVQAYGDPWATIDSPTDEQTYYSDQLIQFSGSVGDSADQPGELEVWWESSEVEGSLDVDADPDSGGIVLGASTLDEGQHLIALRVRNTGGTTAYDTVTIDVGPANSPPTCSITSPPDGSEYETGSSISFQGLVGDDDIDAEDLTVTWSSDQDGGLGSSTPGTDGSVLLETMSLSIATHTITLDAMDEVGATCSADIQLTVLDCPDPWYADLDGDGYGDPDDSITGCSQPTGYVADSSDCDDGESSVHPGADEYCNGLDDDCDGDTDEDDALDADTWYADVDGDGFGDAASSTVACAAPSGSVADGTDCDDGESSIHPGADEYCNGVDDDCDGTVDEDDALDASTWYADADGDGYGDAFSSAPACSQPTGFVADSSDCDDSRPSIYPGADEYCDGADSDCDGVADEDDALDAATWFLDGDSDGYGTASTSTDACTQPSGYAGSDTDCDDSDASINPGASEVWYDGIDSDCDGANDYDADGDGYDHIAYYGDDCDDADTSVNPAAWDGPTDSVDTNCDGEVDAVNLQYPTSWIDDDMSLSPLGYDFVADQDFDLDGLPDVVMVTGYDLYSGEGPVLSFSGADLSAGDLLVSDYAGNLSWGTNASIEAAGDFDGDGYPELFAGVRSYASEGNATGTAYLIGGTDVMAGDATFWDVAISTFDPVDGDNGFGIGTAAVEDRDGDARSELMVGSYAGRAWLFDSISFYRGGSFDTDDAALELTYDTANHIGRVNGVMDLDGDGLSDLISTDEGQSSGSSWTGATWIFLDSTTASATLLTELDADVTINDTRDFFVAGDVDGDGLDDLVVNDSFTETGLIIATALSGTTDVSAATTTFVHPTSDWVGLNVAAGDADADGTVDLALSSQGGTDGDGRVDLFYAVGSLSGTVSIDQADASWFADSTKGYIANTDYAITLSDINADGYDDVLIGGIDGMFLSLYP